MRPRVCIVRSATRAGTSLTMWILRILLALHVDSNRPAGPPKTDEAPSLLLADCFCLN
jgi:hypothetical protein